ncbi:exosortase-associated protein EpsI, B-type [Aquabacterium sp. J223]|uniref:exosortase-associated protein EpsI, B-type n=1 Tax=Aquabacterium sp. J223 TaxID=2898431 RepID=UPI0021AE0A1F|nr:exosortase-associated protein EpsI, B-type [Aquabacterium sp. J223]UUX96855.1 EpsI family protein [Aquabacterium sp. J223]
MKSTTTAAVLAALMIATSMAGFAARPKPRPPGQPPSIVLESAVPKRFGDWVEVTVGQAAVVNPQTQQLLDKLYSQLLTRTYENRVTGARVMLSMAYGDDQRDGLQAHMPEVCYPAQGFKLHEAADGLLGTPHGDIPVKRLSTSLGPRFEPVTYWFTVGDQAIKTRWEKRLIELRFGLTGQVPDGLLFRVSTIDRDTKRAYQVQDQFVQDLLNSVEPQSRHRLSGLAFTG